MEIFEYLRTSFHVIKAFITQDKMIYLGLGVLGLFVAWTVLSLIFSHELRMVRTWNKMRKVIGNGPMTRERYFEFTAHFQKLPAAVARNWKKYERQKTGVPSDYVTQADMLDNPLSGGVHKQNRSIMKFAMWGVVVFFFVFSIASLGANETLTAKIFAESLIVPFVLFMIYRLNYYVYTSIRQYEYRLAVEDFHEFVDLLDRTIDINEIFDGAEDVLEVNSNCYDISNEPKQKEQPNRKVEPIVMKNQKPAEYQFPKNKSGKVEIRSQQDFTEALMVVEKLLEENDENVSDEKSKRVAELMDAMNKYRNKKNK